MSRPELLQDVEERVATLPPPGARPRARAVGWTLWLTLGVLGLAAAVLLARLDELAAWTIAVGLACNIPCAILGCYLVLRRMSLMGDAISHAVLPGIAVGFVLTGQLGGPGILAGAMVFGILTAVLTQTLARFGRVPEDASMGAVFTSLFAIGVILITNVAADVDLDPGCVLYGLLEFAPLYTVEVLGVEVPRALASLVPATALTLGFVALFWKELKLASFDPDLATSMGLNATLVHYLLMGMVAVVTVAAFEAVGSILVVAMLIVPAATAHLLTDRLGAMLALAVVVGVVAAFGGYAGAVAWNTNIAGMMAVVAGGLFAMAVLFAPRHGVLSKMLHTTRLALRIGGEDVLALLYRAAERGENGSGTLDRADCLRAAGGGLVGWLSLVRLRLRGLVRLEADGRLAATAAGLQHGQNLVRSHRLWEVYLSTKLQLPADHLHEPAERLEHYIGPTLREEIGAELQGPDADPHGRAIPPRDAGEGSD